ncbi:MAG: hypothetical protein R2867_09045 [Caldilineaceae bacterium]
MSNQPIEDGLEIDLVTHDVKSTAMVLKRNGYVLEQITLAIDCADITRTC